MNIKQTVTIVALSAIVLAPLAAHAQGVTYRTTTSGNIPDNNTGGITSTITVLDNFIFAEFAFIRLNGISHAFVGDLIVTLSRGGTTVDILDRVRGNGGATFGDSSNLSGNYTFVTSGGSSFNTAAGAVADTGNVSTGASYATVPVGNPVPAGGVWLGRRASQTAED